MNIELKRIKTDDALNHGLRERKEEEKLFGKHSLDMVFIQYF